MRSSISDILDENGNFSLDKARATGAIDLVKKLKETVTIRQTENGIRQFFASRIPSMEQPDVEVVLERENIAEDDVVALLKRFGKRTIANPFELKYSDVIG